MNTIAVGPFEPVASCVTGGATVACPLLHRDEYGKIAVPEEADGVANVARLHACVKGARRAIEKNAGSEIMCSGKHK